MSLFEHQIKSAVCFCHTKRVSCIFIFSFQNQAVFFFFTKKSVYFFSFSVSSSYDLSARLLLSHTVSESTTPPTLSLPVWFHAAKKGGWLTMSEPLGLLAQSHDRADALLQSGAAATTGLCDAEERRGLLCSAEWASRECDKSLLYT